MRWGHRITAEPPDRWQDDLVAVTAAAIFLGVLAFLASWVPQ